MQSVEIKGLDKLDKALQKILDEAPEARRELHERLADMLEQEIHKSIASSSLNDSRGRVRRWQVKHVGSGGGYAAIRPAGSKEGAEIGPNGPGAITNYLEYGHKIRQSKSGKAYRSRIKVPFVSGFHFYDTAAPVAEAQAIRKAEEFANQLAAKIGGTG